MLGFIDIFGFSKLVQRTFKHGKFKITVLPTIKSWTFWYSGMSSYVIIYRSYELLKWYTYWPTLYLHTFTSILCHIQTLRTSIFPFTASFFASAFSMQSFVYSCGFLPSSMYLQRTESVQHYSSVTHTDNAPVKPELHFATWANTSGAGWEGWLIRLLNIRELDEQEWYQWARLYSKELNDRADNTCGQTMYYLLWQ